jgi:predicted Zn-ribbon and HTH transcriptional regulator
MQMDFPRSRIKNPGQCPQCRLHPGRMVDRGRLVLDNTSGRPVELLQWTCDKCGYTMLFDLDVARSRPWDQEDRQVQELPIDPPN